MTLNYLQPLYRPPSEAENLIIQATLGCSFNQCSFCSMYKGKIYSTRSLDDISREINQVSRTWPDASRVFLADGDALALPVKTLVSILEVLESKLPRLTRVSCYATPANILAKTAKELKLLRAHKLKLLYLGIESGSDIILKKITKGATQRGLSEAMTRAYQAGLKVSGTVILGLGGQNYWQEHIEATASLLNSAPLSYLSTLQLYLDESVIDDFHHKFAERFLPQNDIDILFEQQLLVQNLEPVQPVIFRSNHASNALALAGNLPRDRSRLLDEIESAIKGNTPLRPMSQRGL